MEKSPAETVFQMHAKNKKKEAKLKYWNCVKINTKTILIKKLIFIELYYKLMPHES